MSERARHPVLVEAIDRRLLGLPCCGEQGRRRHHDGKLRDQNAAALDATVNSNTTAARYLGFANRGVEKFGHANAIHHLLVCRYSPLPHKAKGNCDSVPNSTQELSTTNRHCCAACSISTQFVHVSAETVHSASVNSRCAA